MTLHAAGYEIGVRDLHDRLSEHLEHVERGAELLVTRRGKPIARLSAVDHDDALDGLVQRGLVSLPQRPRQARSARVKAQAPVSDLIGEQRR